MFHVQYNNFFICIHHGQKPLGTGHKLQGGGGGGYKMGGGHVKIYPYEKGGGNGFSHTEEGGHTKF